MKGKGRKGLTASTGCCWYFRSGSSRYWPHSGHCGGLSCGKNRYSLRAAPTISELLPGCWPSSCRYPYLWDCTCFALRGFSLHSGRKRKVIGHFINLKYTTPQSCTISLTSPPPPTCTSVRPEGPSANVPSRSRDSCWSAVPQETQDTAAVH